MNASTNLGRSSGASPTPRRKRALHALLESELCSMPPEGGRHELAPLPYDHVALEPHIDARTMQIHHDKHHRSYVAKLNAALEKHPSLRQKSAYWLLLNLDQVPAGSRTAVRNNGGGHVNHTMFWRAMAPGAQRGPEGALADAIDRDFGSLDRFKERFSEAGVGVFGSGWVWLVRAVAGDGTLRIMTTSGHANPVAKGHFPILVNDVWEHAYYLKHTSARDDYLDGWWAVCNWAEAGRRFQRAS